MYDFHTHFIPEEIMSWVKENKTKVNAKWIEKDASKNTFLEINRKWGFELKDAFIDFSKYSSELKNAGITHAVTSPIPQLFMYDFDPVITTEVSRVYNDALANLSNSNPDIISALGTVPLNSPEQAAELLQDAMNEGLKGAIIGPGISGHMLSDDYFIPFFEEANKLKAIVFIHPLLSEDPRLKRRMMPNLIGVPWETTVCATDLLLSGFTDTYPDIKVLFAHGGGYLPYQLGRLDKGFKQWGAVSTNLKAFPSEYAKLFWYDTVLWNEKSIDYLKKMVGEKQVVPGSDFPFDLSAWPPIQVNKDEISTLFIK
ncbi:amidohydrolase family protein [Pseudogracilibacillus sp. SO30301A]|uniref:amidohydrolase family protein n=1 Tax=Pseudogracilibacillus sp. SO30301A TaxID=3098291 RepID=UPI00300DD988